MKYNIDKSDEAIICNRQILPHFGFGDIEIKGHFLTCNFPHSYSLKSLKNELTNGIDHIIIMVIEMEVFTLEFLPL